jgi:hypothetical protein
MLTNFTILSHEGRMKRSNLPLVKDEVPELATQLADLLERTGETVLAAQVQNLAVFERVDHRHGSDIYTAPRPDGAWGMHHRTLPLRPGALHIDIVSGQIVLIELLRKPTPSVQNS